MSKSETVLGCILMGALLLFGAICEDSNRTLGIIMMIGALIILIVMVIRAFITGKETEQARKENMSYNRETGILTLYKVSPINSNVISIVSDYDFKTSYEPEKYVYTGATVGGITTGGFHKAGGYSYISDAKKNGGAFLVYITTELTSGGYKDKDNLIVRIELSGEAVQDAIKLGIVSASLPSKFIETYVTNGKNKGSLPYDRIRRIRDFVCHE